MGSDRNPYGNRCAVATREKTAVLSLRTIVLFTLHALLNAIIRCLQLNTGRCRGCNPEGGLLVIDAVGLTVYVSCCNARISFHSVYSYDLSTRALFVNCPVMTHKYRGSQQSSREVKPKFIDSTQGEPKNIYKL